MLCFSVVDAVEEYFLDLDFVEDVDAVVDAADVDADVDNSSK
ncbi:hypothetical protein [Romboutsia weinsteinii]|nr:hypothetical protein [Romboutsia weinsteinii]